MDFYEKYGVFHRFFEQDDVFTTNQLPTTKTLFGGV